jgi:predicted RNase H-like HicB family nuclease
MRQSEWLLARECYVRSEISAMRRIIQVRIYKGEEQYVGECIDLPVVTQGKTLDEVSENLREAIALYLEGEDPAEFDWAPDPSILASFELSPLTHAKT